MATDDLNQKHLDDVVAAAHATKDDFDKEYAAAQAELLDRKRKRAADKQALLTAAAVIDERHVHETEPLLEKLDEYDRIDKQRKADVAPEPQPESQTPAKPEPTPEPKQKPDAPSDDADKGDHTRVDIPPVPPAPAQGPSSNLQHFNPKNWGGRAWLFAIIGAVIGLVLARVTYDPMWSHVHHGWHIALVIIWFVILIPLGFFAGGWFGASLDEKHNSQEA